MTALADLLTNASSDQNLADDAETVKKKLEDVPRPAANLRAAMTAQKAAMDTLIAATPSADRAAERVAYRTAMRSIFRDKIKAELSTYFTTMKDELAETVDVRLNELLTQIATDNSTTLQQLLIDIGDGVVQAV